MKIKIKIASFNISGGFYVGNEDTEYLDRAAVDSIDNKMLDQIIETINSEKIDIMCFQEIITTERIHYLEKIAENTDLKYYDSFEVSECNIVKDTNFGVAIFSRFPMQCIIKEFFPNPGLTKTTDSGNTYYLYDKGYMICDIDVDLNKLSVLTHHGFPFRRFNSTPEDNPEVFKFFDEKIKEYNPDIITGDFNSDNFMELMENTSKTYRRTIDTVTTVDGKRFDDILVRNGREASTKIMKLLSDHFLIIDEIEVE